MTKSLHSRKVLVLGASNLQVPAIIRSKQLGCDVFVVDRDPMAPGMALADRSFEVSTNDIEGIVRVAETLEVDAVLTLGTDLPMRGVAAIGKRLHLTTPSPEAVAVATDKGLMAIAFGERGVASPNFAICSRQADVIDAVRSVNLPAILKPVDNSGSRGVQRADTLEQAIRAYGRARALSRSGQVIVQELMEGREVSVEGFCDEGGVHVVQVTDKITSGPPYFVEMGHSQPSSLRRSVWVAVESLVSDAVRALGLRDCAVHAEVMVTPSGPKMIELGARLGGDYIASHLVPLSTGIDMVEALIRLACGEPLKLAATRSRGSAIRFLGTAAQPPAPWIVDAARGMDGVFDVTVNSNRAGEIRSSSDRSGHVITCGETAAIAVAAAERAREAMEAGRSMDSIEAGPTKEVKGDA